MAWTAAVVQERSCGSTKAAVVQERQLLWLPVCNAGRARRVPVGQCRPCCAAYGDAMQCAAGAAVVLNNIIYDDNLSLRRLSYLLCGVAMCSVSSPYSTARDQQSCSCGALCILLLDVFQYKLSACCDQLLAVSSPGLWVCSPSESLVRNHLRWLGVAPVLGLPLANKRVIH